MASPSWVWAFSRTRSSSRAACQVAMSTTGGRPVFAVVESFGVVAMLFSVVSGQRCATRDADSPHGQNSSAACRYVSPAPGLVRPSLGPGLSARGGSGEGAALDRGAAFGHAL